MRLVTSKNLCILIYTLNVLILIGIGIYCLQLKRMNEKIVIKPFNNVWDEKNKKMLIDCISTIDTIFNEMNIKWCAWYGTLLGAVRHQDVIPWDDDADILVSDKLKNKIGEFRHKLKLKGYQLSSECEAVPFKVFSNDAELNITKEWGWPFVDIFFQKKNEINEIVDKTKRVKFSHLINGIPIPLNYKEILDKEYGKECMNECVSSNFNHRYEYTIDDVHTTKCKFLNLDNVLSLRDIPAFTINLDHRKDRWEQTQSELKKVGLISTRVSAVDASKPEFKKYYDGLPSPKRSLPETACSASHLKVLKQFLNTNEEYALIFEDDMTFSPNTTYEMLNNALNQSKNLKLLLLGHCFTSQSEYNNNGCPFIGAGLCAHAYVISREGAKDMLKVYSIDEPIDVVMQKLCERTGGLCYLTSEVDKKRSFNHGNGSNGLVYQLDSAGSNITQRGIY